jgi:anthraniloyl-CoA monooxygenase
MRIAIAGGGPGGLYAAILFSRLGHDVTVWERNAPDDTFGFGVVFSDETLNAFEHADPLSFAQITASFARWADIDIHYKDRVLRSGGHGFSAISRKQLLGILQERAAGLGAEVRFLVEAPSVDDLSREHDLVIAADGVNSQIRAQRAFAFQPTLDPRHNKFMWLGTDRVYEAFTFHIVENDHGVFQIHAYPFDDTMSTFIVETNEATWRRAGLDHSENTVLRPGESDEHSLRYSEQAFEHILGDHRLLANNSKWLNFNTVRNAHWHDGNVVLLGDAAHTAHWSIGSGTKLAMEDAIALAWAFKESGRRGDVGAVLQAYEEERRPVVESTQRAAQASLEWFENVDRYVRQGPDQFAFNLLTRSRRITYDNLRLRDESFLDHVDRDFARRSDSGSDLRPPMFHPFRLRELELANRVVVSPMDMYSAVDGVVGDFHLVHLGIRGIGGAGLVMTEMICVAAEGRITPGCGGLYDDGQIPGWRRIVDFVHQHGSAAIGAQIGHAGRMGATQLLWEGMDRPLETGGWPLVSASPLPYYPDSQIPAELSRQGMDEVRQQFVDTTKRALEAGFDLLELHMAHGYLLSSFLSPVTNVRTDEYGGDLANRAKFPLEVFDACRAVWPTDKPMSVRLSATDWIPGGFDVGDAVAFAAMLRDHGCDIVDVSSGQVAPEQKPQYGRSFQTPFADRIRNEVGIPTIAVGALSSYEDVNTNILAGRCDLCAVGRPHLYDPFWTLHAAAEQGYDRAEHWIDPYKAGSRRPNDGRLDIRKPPPRSFDSPNGDIAHQRWRPSDVARSS